jgi:hypothetical protein
LWVKIPSTLGSSQKLIYVYYGNASALAAVNGTNTFDFFDDFSNPAWATLPDMPVNIADETVSVYNNKVYLFGGYTNGISDQKGDTYMFDPSSNPYAEIPSLLRLGVNACPEQIS